MTTAISQILSSAVSPKKRPFFSNWTRFVFALFLLGLGLSVSENLRAATPLPNPNPFGSPTPSPSPSPAPAPSPHPIPPGRISGDYHDGYFVCRAGQDRCLRMNAFIGALSHEISYPEYSCLGPLEKNSFAMTVTALFAGMEEAIANRLQTHSDTLISAQKGLAEVINEAECLKNHSEFIHREITHLFEICMPSGVNTDGHNCAAREEPEDPSGSNPGNGNNSGNNPGTTPGGSNNPGGNNSNGAGNTPPTTPTPPTPADPTANSTPSSTTPAPAAPPADSVAAAGGGCSMTNGGNTPQFLSAFFLVGAPALLGLTRRRA